MSDAQAPAHLASPAHPVPAAQPAPAPRPSGPTAEQLALEAGWTMAVLYGTIEPTPQAEALQGEAPGLPTANELQPAERRRLELDRLSHLLQRLAAMPDFAGSGLPAKVPAPNEDDKALKDALRKLNLEILCALAATRQGTQLAYELGRSLRDTANPPDQHPPALPPDQHPPTLALARQFDRDRIATLQGWLAELSSDLPPHAELSSGLPSQAAAVVAASLGRWSEFAAVTASAPGARLRNNASTTVAETTAKYLLRQGDLWLGLLTGARSTSGLLSPDGYVAAGELALRRSAAIIRRIFQRYWPALLIGAVALSAILYLAVTYLGGAAKVWTSIAAIAGSLGITARAVASTAARLTAEAESPIFAMAEEDVMAWAITTMPQVRLTRRGVRNLRKAGIAPTSSLGRS